MEVFQAGSEHLEEVSKLFDQYRVFYNSSSDYEAGTEFLKERFKERDSIIFAASIGGRIVGFTQLYPSFSSVSMKRVLILNDLFVNEGCRGKGIAKSLMSAVENFARETECARIVLATQISNGVAQSLYESCGYAKDEEFYHYVLRL